MARAILWPSVIARLVLLLGNGGSGLGGAGVCVRIPVTGALVTVCAKESAMVVPGSFIWTTS
jgi:hypothetical protein